MQSRSIDGDLPHGRLRFRPARRERQSKVRQSLSVSLRRTLRDETVLGFSAPLRPGRPHLLHRHRRQLHRASDHHLGHGPARLKTIVDRRAGRFHLGLRRVRGNADPGFAGRRTRNSPRTQHAFAFSMLYRVSHDGRPPRCKERFVEVRRADLRIAGRFVGWRLERLRCDQKSAGRPRLEEAHQPAEPEISSPISRTARSLRSRG